MREIFIPFLPACSETKVYINYIRLLKQLPIIWYKRITISNKNRKKRIRNLCLIEQPLNCE